MKPIAFDLSAMFAGAASDTPRGIDRVDMGYAKKIFRESCAENVGLLPSPSRMGVLNRGEAQGFATLVEQRWQETATPADDGALSTWLRRRLAGEAPPRPTHRRGACSRTDHVLRFAPLVLKARGTPLRPARTAVPRDAIYINTGQVLLGYRWFFDWLENRPDVKPVFMMHDLIPVFYPEYSGPEMALRHELALDTVARRAVGMIATSHASAAEIREALKKRGRCDIPIHVTPLPVGDAFVSSEAHASFVSDAPFFVAVGAIDQRKNHLLLLNAWREIARFSPPSRPKLVIVGIRGKRSAGVIDFLRRCPALAESVIEVNGLPTPAMRDLIRSASALLMPSFTEGYGLPVVEALALGTPVIASDIPAHREVGGGFVTYLSPMDGNAWISELVKRAHESREDLAVRRSMLSGYRPQTWTSYFEHVSPFLESL